MFIQITGVTTWGVPVDIVIEAAHRWPVDEAGRIDITPPDDELDSEGWLVICEPAFSLEMSYLFGQWEIYDLYEQMWFEELTVREAPPDRTNYLTGQPPLPALEPLFIS